MTTWIWDYLEKNTDMSRQPVVLQAEHATHFRLAPGLMRAVISGAPQYRRAGRDWLPWDLRLQADLAGRLGAEGHPVRLHPDGLVLIAGKHYFQHTLGVGTLNAGAYTELAHLPDGRAEGARVVRESGPFRHELILTENGVKEQLTITELPSGLAGEYLVYETAVPAGAFRNGELRGDVTVEGLRIPAGRGEDAAGRAFALARFASEGRLYTGLPLSIVAQATFPLVLDPSINLTGQSADGHVLGQASSYATARNTSSSVDTGSAEFFVGQAYDSAIPRYSVYRSFLKFDLSSISPQAEVLSATLGLVCTVDSSTLADFDIQIVKETWSGQDPLSDANREAAYDNCLAGALDAVWRNTSGLATGTQYISPPLDGNYPTPGGLAYYSLRGSRDKNNTAPPSNGNEYVRIAAANHSTPSYRPLLIVDYASAFPAVLRAALPSPTTTIVDTRRKLRARPRAASLTTTVRKEG